MTTRLDVTRRCGTALPSGSVSRVPAVAGALPEKLVERAVDRFAHARRLHRAAIRDDERIGVGDGGRREARVRGGVAGLLRILQLWKDRAQSVAVRPRLILQR